jgi:hypothetical protein
MMELLLATFIRLAPLAMPRIKTPRTIITMLSSRREKAEREEEVERKEGVEKE